MGKDIEFDILGGYEKEEFNELDPQQTVNMFYVRTANGRTALFPTPGLSLPNGINFSQQIGGTGRAVKTVVGGSFCVIKNTVFELIVTNKGLDHFEIGTLNTERGYVAIYALNNQIVFVDGVNGWIWDTSTSLFSQITDIDFPSKPIDATVLGNRVLVQDGETKLTYYSDFGDASKWNINNRNAFTSYTDTNVACETLNGRLFIMGEQSVEPWYQIEQASIDPYRRSDLAFDFGCAAIGSVASGFGILVWLSKTAQGVGSIVATTGGRPIPISSQALDTELESYDDVSDASAYIYKNELGHIIYVINFTDANKSWGYDFSTKKPHQLEFQSKDRHLAQKHTYIGGKHYVIDYSAPHLYEMSSQYYDDDVTPKPDDAAIKIRRARISSILEAPPGTHLTVNKLTVKLKQGTGGDCGFEEDPILFLQTSFDEGESYGNALSEPIGKIGRRTWSTSFDRFGNTKSMVFKLEHYNAVPFVILRADLDIDVQKGRD